MILAVAVHAANVPDSVGARALLKQVDAERFPRLLLVWADGAYQGSLEDWAADEQDLEVVIVPKHKGQRTFVVLPKRWMTEAPAAPERYRGTYLCLAHALPSAPI